ncbi:MAG: diphthine--ammonia ligase [Flavobacteriaceae bacterium]|nr:diphthine--ammonia ligase [Flavobacteriaceae bacterium]
MKIISSWSGGKDSCYALMQILKDNSYELISLLNMMNENGKISRSHGLPHAILNQQAAALGKPIKGIPATWGEYEENYIQGLKELKEKYNSEAVVYGDIDLESHREWEEKVCNATNHLALLPLWQQDRKELVYAMIDSGIKAIIVSCNKLLGEAFLGKEITRELVVLLEEKGVDVCGENGEYHTAVIDCPLFNKPVTVPKYNKVTHTNYCFLTWE